MRQADWHETGDLARNTGDQESVGKGKEWDGMWVLLQSHRIGVARTVAEGEGEEHEEWGRGLGYTAEVKVGVIEVLDGQSDVPFPARHLQEKEVGEGAHERS